MRTINAWLNKLLHVTSKDKAETRKSAKLCELCAQWDFSTVFRGEEYPAYKYGIIKDVSRYELWDVRSLETLRFEKTCPMCSFFLTLLIDRGHIREEDASASENDLVVQFNKDLMRRGSGAVYLRVIDRPASQASHFDVRNDYDEAASGREWIRVLPEGLENHYHGGKRLKPYCNFEELSSWVRECSEGQNGPHFGCAEGRFETYTMKTLRLIDVKAMCLDVKQLPTKYAALSYVWGPSHLVQLKLYQGNVEAMSKRNALRKQWDQVPTTIKDAIKVCNKCGIRYLWVDALCLIQNAPDLPQHLGKMTEIYDTAVMTIVAACASSSWTGLSGVSIARLSQHRVSIGKIALIEALPPLGAELENSRWSQRGWTFQEHIFSRRCLFFLQSRVVFQCHGGWIDESIDCDYSGLILEQAIILTRMSLPASKYRFDFLCFVECFCRLELTYDSDTLKACSGVIAWLEQKGTQFFWATPTHRIVDGLDFETKGLERRPGYPSWSWLGWRRPHAQDKSSQGFFSSRKLIETKDLCKIDILSPNNDQRREASEFETLQLSANDLDKLLMMEAPVANFSELEGALLCRDDLEHCDIRPHFSAYNDDEACKIELVGLTQEFDLMVTPLYVKCLIIKTNVRGLSERIDVARVELSKWQTAEVNDRVAYLI